MHLRSSYRNIPKISPRAYIFQGPFLRGLYLEGLCTDGNLRLEIDWASLILGRKLTVFLCFTLYLRVISKYKPPGGLKFGGVYTWRGLISEFYGTIKSVLHFVHVSSNIGVLNFSSAEWDF